MSYLEKIENHLQDCHADTVWQGLLQLDDLVKNVGDLQEYLLFPDVFTSYCAFKKDLTDYYHCDIIVVWLLGKLAELGFSNIPSIKTIDLGDCKFDPNLSLKPLEKLPFLEEIIFPSDVAYNEEDIFWKSLANFTNLKYLDLSNIEDLSRWPLTEESLPQLQTLNIAGTLLNSLPLKLPSLRILNVSPFYSIETVDFSKIGYMPQLEKLILLDLDVLDLDEEVESHGGIAALSKQQLPKEFLTEDYIITEVLLYQFRPSCLLISEVHFETGA